jgi:hypothetical protein
VDARGLFRGRFPAGKSRVFGSEFEPRDPSSCVGLVLLYMSVVFSGPELVRSGPELTIDVGYVLRRRTCASKACSRPCHIRTSFEAQARKVRCIFSLSMVL